VSHVRARRLGSGVLLALMALAGAAAGDASIRIEDPWVRRAPAPPGPGPDPQSKTAAYLTIVNRGATPDTLLSATADVATSVELHQTREVGGMMTMAEVPKIAVAAGARVSLKPGGYHLMLIGLRHGLGPGQTVTLTLRFERAGPVTARAGVR
jgi:copper(I)-binding protein